MTARRLGAARRAARGAMKLAEWDVGANTGLDGEQRKAETRTVVLVSADTGLCQRLASSLTGLRWRVREAHGGAQAMMHLEQQQAEAMLVDDWLPDLEAREFAAHVRLLYPRMDLLHLKGDHDEEWGATARREEKVGRAQSARRNELLQVLRMARAGDESADGIARREAEAYRLRPDGSLTDGTLNRRGGIIVSAQYMEKRAAGPDASLAWGTTLLPELVGDSPVMREMARLVRLVAPRSTTVLIEGETGTGKEVVAKALHRLSPRAAKPFAVLNCAAIPEPLLEAELFGHSRGAFTGAVQSRMGRIEAADGGTLLLDEIGEMPLGMQAKMLRFLESGELQRVGENDTTQVDVRLIAATHEPLAQRSADRTFRLDLYHRLAVFPIEVPPLRERMQDIAILTEHFLELMGQDAPRKRLAPDAVAKLQEHRWPGNVRELMHVLERGAILAGVNPEIAAADIRYRRVRQN